jgi:hypothetical protein
MQTPSYALIICSPDQGTSRLSFELAAVFKPALTMVPCSIGSSVLGLLKWAHVALQDGRQLSKEQKDLVILFQRVCRDLSQGSASIALVLLDTTFVTSARMLSTQSSHGHLTKHLLVT